MTGAMPEGRSWIWRGRRAEAPLLLAALPPEVPFAFVGRALPSGDESELRLEVHPVPTAEAAALLERSELVARAELATGDTGPPGRSAERARQAEAASELAREVADQRQGLFRVGIAWAARGRTRRDADGGRSGIARRLEALGFRTRVPVYAARAAVAPPRFDAAERRPPGYWHTLSTDGVAAFFPLIEESVLESGGILAGLLIDDGGPVLLDRFAHASHSWGLFGATGAGKSFAAALWAIRSRWMVPGLELYFVDPLGEFGALATALGGTHLRIGPESGVGFDPLDPVSAGGDRAATAARAGALLRALFPSLGDEEAAALDAALGRLYRDGPAIPSFADLRAAITAAPEGAGRLPTLLEVFRTGSLRHLDRPGRTPAPRLPVAFDLSGVPEPQRAFHLGYVLEGLYARLRAGPAPKLVVVDEAHLLARTPGTLEFLDRMVRHVRHYRAGLLLLTQGPDDFLVSDTGRSLLRNLRASVLLRLPSVSPATREFFDLTDAEAEWLPKARLPVEAAYSEGLLRFGPSHLPMAIVASAPEFDFLRAHLAGARPPAAL